MPRLEDYIPEGLPEQDVAELTEDGARELGIPIDAPHEWPDAYAIRYDDFSPNDEEYEHPTDPSGPDAVEPPEDPAPTEDPPGSKMASVLRSMTNVLKLGYDERLHPRDILGRFTAKPFSAVLGPGGSAANPHDRKTARAVGRHKGRKRAYDGKRLAETAQRRLDDLKDRVEPNAEIERQYYQGLLEGMAERADHGTNAGRDADTSLPRAQRKLPQPKMRRRGGLDRKYAPGYSDGMKAAGAVGEKRRRWMQRKAAEILAEVPEDHPQREYWQGVADYDPEKAAQEKREEFKRLEVAQRQRRLDAKRAEGKRAYNDYVSGFAYTELDKDIKQKIVDAGTDEEAKAYWEGAQEAVHANQEKRDAKKRAKKMRAEGFKKGAAIRPEDREEEAAQAYRMRLAAPREDVQAMWEGVLQGLGKPTQFQIKAADKNDVAYKLGYKLGRLAQERPDEFHVDLDAAKAQLAATAGGDQRGVLHWAGILDGLLEPPPPSVHIEHLPDAPDTGDLPSDARKRALLHRVPGDEELATSPITEVTNLGGGVNTTKVGKLANGQKVIVKPIRGAYGGRLRHNIPRAADLQRERAGWFAANQLGITRIPRTVARDVAGEGPSTVMEFIDDANTYIGRPPGVNLNKEDLHNVALLDAVIGNTDRHQGNAMVTNDGHVIPIDHGLSFPTDNSGFRWDIGPRKEEDRILTPQDIGNLRKFDTDAMQAEFERMGIELDAVIAMRERVRAILQLGKIPSSAELRKALGFAY